MSANNAGDADREQHGVDDDVALTAKTQVRVSLAQLFVVCGAVIGAGVWCYGVKHDIGVIKADIAGIKETGWQSGDSDRYRDRVQGAIDVWEEKLERDLSSALGKPFTLPRFQLPTLSSNR